MRKDNQKNQNCQVTPSGLDDVSCFDQVDIWHEARLTRWHAGSKASLEGYSSNVMGVFNVV